MIGTFKEKELVLPCWVVTFYIEGEQNKEYFFFGGEFSSARDEAYSFLKWQPENCWKFRIEFKDITYVMSE